MLWFHFPGGTTVHSSSHWRSLVTTIVLGACWLPPASAQPVKPRPQKPTASDAQKPQPLTQLDPSLLKSLHWRAIGPFRGGRTRAVAGVPTQTSVFYIGVCNGGVWKTNDFGRTWQPIFDDQPTGSIGSLAVAQSDPNIVYVGSGEGLH